MANEKPPSPGSRRRRPPSVIDLKATEVPPETPESAPEPQAEAAAPPSDPPPYTNPVMAGDFPDPTAMRIGPEYWAISTASSGRPSPPILRSPDLVHWTVAGNLFTEPRLQACLQQANGAAPTEVIRNALEAVKQFATGAEQSDDITTLAIRYLRH